MNTKVVLSRLLAVILLASILLLVVPSAPAQAQGDSNLPICVLPYEDTTLSTPSAAENLIVATAYSVSHGNQGIYLVDRAEETCNRIADSGRINGVPNSSMITAASTDRQCVGVRYGGR